MYDEDGPDYDDGDQIQFANPGGQLVSEAGGLGQWVVFHGWAGVMG